jgi:hypothetical protein
MPGPVASPAAGPSAITPGPQAGLEAQAMIKVRQAVMLLADSIGMLKGKLQGDLGKGVLGALKILAPLTPGVEEGLGQSELSSMLAGLNPVRQAPPNFLGMRPPTPNVTSGPPIGGGKPPMPPGIR